MSLESENAALKAELEQVKERLGRKLKALKLFSAEVKLKDAQLREKDIKINSLEIRLGNRERALRNIMDAIPYEMSRPADGM